MNVTATQDVDCNGPFDICTATDNGAPWRERLVLIASGEPREDTARALDQILLIKMNSCRLLNAYNARMCL